MSGAPSSASCSPTLRGRPASTVLATRYEAALRILLYRSHFDDVEAALRMIGFALERGAEDLPEIVVEDTPKASLQPGSRCSGVGLMSPARCPSAMQRAS